MCHWFFFADSNAHAAHTTPTIDSNAHNLYNTYIDSISSSNYIMDFVVVVFRHRRKQKNKFHFIGWSLCVYGQKYTKKKTKNVLATAEQYSACSCILFAVRSAIVFSVKQKTLFFCCSLFPRSFTYLKHMCVWFILLLQVVRRFDRIRNGMDVS